MDSKPRAAGNGAAKLALVLSCLATLISVAAVITTWRMYAEFTISTETPSEVEDKPQKDEAGSQKTRKPWSISSSNGSLFALSPDSKSGNIGLACFSTGVLGLYVRYGVADNVTGEPLTEPPGTTVGFGLATGLHSIQLPAEVNDGHDLYYTLDRPGGKSALELLLHGIDKGESITLKILKYENLQWVFPGDAQYRRAVEMVIEECE